MSTRADRYTQLQKTPDLFSDFLTSLDPHPVTKDITRIRNDQSIKQSLKNLILTTYGERPFQPKIGSNVYRALFEPNDDFIEDDLETSIRTTIETNEPRVSLINLEIDSNSLSDSIRINIIFIIINTQETQSLELILRRVR